MESNVPTTVSLLLLSCAKSQRVNISIPILNYLERFKNKTVAFQRYGLSSYHLNLFLSHDKVLLHLLKRYILYILCAAAISTGLLLLSTSIGAGLLLCTALLLLRIINILACCCPCIIQFGRRSINCCDILRFMRFFQFANRSFYCRLFISRDLFSVFF